MIGACNGAKHVSWKRLARENRAKNGRMARGMGKRWRPFACHLKGTQCESLEGRSFTPPQPGSREYVHTFSLIYLTSSEPLMEKQTWRPGGAGVFRAVMWEECLPEKRGKKKGRKEGTSEV